MQKNINEILSIAQNNQKSAYQLIENLKIEKLWESIGCEINLVGSLKTGLLMKHLDIDFHVYSNELSIEKSFSVILELIKNPKVKKFSFKNLMHTEENCLEWHLFCCDEFDREWQIDIIHMLQKSKYYGYFENVADRILLMMNEQIKNIILKLKYETPEDIKIMGIEYYRAVLEFGINNYADFIDWHNKNKVDGILFWTP